MMRYFGLLFTILFVALKISASSMVVCITNCVQCKQMFGRYFEGEACGQACLISQGQMTPDCNNPGTLDHFLKRLY